MRRRRRRKVGQSRELGLGSLSGRVIQERAANEFAKSVSRILNPVRKAGATTLSEIAEALNERGVRSAGGGNWHRSAVRNLLIRAQSCEA
jgi:hypothetical protein